MKKRIRLSESDLHNIIKESINEVLDTMNDTEKAYWLMRQRQERPNLKSKTGGSYASKFADKFNNEVYGRDGIHYGVDAGDQASGNAYVRPSNGAFRAYQNAGWNHQGKGRDFYYEQSHGSYQGKFSAPVGGEQINPKDIDIHPKIRNYINKGRMRYNQIQQKYDQQRQQANQQGNQSR